MEQFSVEFMAKMRPSEVYTNLKSTLESFEELAHLYHLFPQRLTFSQTLHVSRVFILRLKRANNLNVLL